MAKRVRSTSTKHPQGESKPEEQAWRTPTVIAAIIAGVVAIIVAVIQLTGPKSKPQEPITIEQQTHGPDSPAVGQTGGNVTIQHQQGNQKP